MKRKFIKQSIILASLMFLLPIMASCETNKTEFPSYNDDVVKAFKVINPQEKVISQTATSEQETYLVTLITEQSVLEYNIDQTFNITDSKVIVGETPVLASLAPYENVSEPSILEKVYTEALNLSQISKDDIISFDFDKDTYMGELVYKVEIEDLSAEYTYVFKASDFSLVDSKTKLKNNKVPADSSYISETQAKNIAFNVVGVEEKNVQNITIKNILNNGRKLYKVSFDYDSYRYQVDIDAVNGDIVKYSKNILDEKVNNNNINEIIDEESAKQIAISFVFNDDFANQNINFLKIKLDYEKNIFVYEIEFVANNNEYEFEINAYTGDIIDVEMDVHDDKKLPETSNFISQEDALQKLKDYLKQDFIVLEVDVEKENVNGQKVYYYEFEIKIGNKKVEYIVDAITGTINSKNQDDNHHDYTDVLISQDQAREAILNKFPNATIKDVELEDKGLGANKKYYYEVEVILNGREYDYYVDAKTGEVFSNDELLSNNKNLISEEKALEIALKHFSLTVSETLMLKIELEEDDGMIIYEIKFMVKDMEYTIEINAQNGNIIDIDISFD